MTRMTIFCQLLSTYFFFLFIDLIFYYIFGNVDGSWRVTSKLRGSTPIQVARRCLKVFQRFSASLVRVGDVQDVPRRHAVQGKKFNKRSKSPSVEC